MHMLKKRVRINASTKKQQTRYLKKSHKFDMELSKAVEQALALDAVNGNTLWADALFNELENVIVVFETSLDGKKTPIVHQFV